MAHPELTSVTLDQYALVLCATGEGASLEIALEAASVSPRDWPAAEAQIAAWIATARTDPGLLPAFDEAMRKAREALARHVTPLDDDASLWGRWLCAWSSAQDPIGMLDRSGMAMTDVVRLSTSWGERLREDRALAERFAAEMQGNAPAPEVRVGESPRLAAAKAALAARKKSELPPLDRPARPALFGALPGEAPPADTASPAAAPPVVSPLIAQPSFAQPEGHDPSPEPRAVPSFMTTRGPVSPPLGAPAQAIFPPAQAQAISPPAQAASPLGLKGLVTRPIPVHSVGGGDAPAPLPFDPSARPEEMPSQGPQRQSGLTNDVDVSAIVRKVLAFQPSASAAPPNVKVVAPPNASVGAPSMPVSSSPNVPITGTPIGETTNVDVAAIARQVLAFGPQKKPETPSSPAARPPIGTPFAALPKVAASPVATPPIALPPAAPAAAKSPVASPLVPSPAVAPIVPTLTVEQYASLCVDIESSPAHAAEILRRYGANEAGKRVLDEGWSRIFADQPARRAAFEKAKVSYRTWLSQGGRR